MASSPEKESCRESSKKTSEHSSEDDLRLLLDCLKFQQHCVSAQKQALTTIATMCSNSNTSRNLFNTTGGLSYVLELLFSSQSLELQQAALYTLGCASENNLVNQLKLCNEQLFSFLAESMVMKPAPSNGLPSTLMMAVAFLSGCLMSNNVQGQKLAKNTGLLSKLISMCKAVLPLSKCSKTEEVDGASAVSLKQPPKYRLWSSVCSALCTATNNPQNDVNQSQCIKLFPAALSVLSTTPFDESAVRPAVSLLASCTANNKGAQDRLRMVGGLKTLINTLNTAIHYSQAQFCELPIHIVKSLSAAAFGHSVNCSTLVELDCIGLLLGLLQSTDLDDSTKLNIVLCLGMLTEDNTTAQKKVSNKEGVRLLIDIMAGSQSEELSKATAFVLQCCVDKTQSSSYATAFSEKIAHIDKLLSRGGNLNGSTPGDDNITQEDLEMLATKKLPAKDLVMAWLDTCVPETVSPPSKSWAVEQSLKTTPHQDVEECEMVSVPHTTQKADSEVMQELRKEKEWREQLEAKLKEEQEKRERLEKELLERKMAIQPVAETGTNIPLPLSVHSNSQATVQERATTTPPISTRTNIRYANSTRPHPKAINRLTQHSKLMVSRQHSQPKPSYATHSLVNLVYKFGSQMKKKAIDCKNTPAKKETQDTGSPHLLKKTSCQMNYSKKATSHRSDKKRCETHREHKLQCLGCTPRLKCPLITSRNFIKLLRVDQYTCSYHRRIAFKLKGDDVIPSSAKSLIHHHFSDRLKHPPLVSASQQSSAPSSSEAATTVPPDIDHGASPQEQQSSNVSSATIGNDPNYLPSSSWDDSVIVCTPPAKTDMKTVHPCSQHVQGRVTAPPNYKLLPCTCGTFKQNAKRFQRQPFGEITNVQPAKTTGGGSGKSLAVFDYATPQEKSKYLPQRSLQAAPIEPKPAPKKRAKAVLWSKQEEQFLIEGVQLLGLGQWRHILAAYKFHPSRDCSSLRVKYRNMCHHK